MRQTIALGAACLAAILYAVTPAAARELKASVHLPPKNDTVANGYRPFMKYVKERSKGDLTIKLFTGGALLGPRAVTQGVRDGVVDIGYVIVGYHPAEYPYLGAFANDMSGIGVDPVVVTAATTEWVMLHCPPCLKDFEKQGNVFTGASAVPGMVIMSKVKIEKPEDLKGLKIRSNGSFWDEFIKSLDAVPVNVPSSEQYEALNRGIVEAVIHVPSSMKTYSLWDTVKDVTLLNFGVYRSINTFSINPETWRSLSADQRRIILASAMDANLDIAHGYEVTGAEALEGSRKKGIRIHSPTEALQARIDAFIKKANVNAVEIGKTKYEIADADKVVATVMQLTDKWQRIWQEMNGDLDKFKTRTQEEIISKLDPQTYGVTH
ncbi:MAG TPA: C4-dicarboxylate TRAP transporter substrate-binding protein [Reyranella sp.]|jgi:TRAP-type C4-dicarboxylate transport system substrate-binding protein|nr:C4-dicarboxylate TRAP transporter substrate-binding protein [Reyranella sp.]